MSQRVTGRLHNGDYPFAGSFCLQLGEPAECGEHPAASTWMYYTVHVPHDAPSPTLSFRYRVFTNDLLEWASFIVEIRHPNNVTLAQVVEAGYDPPDRIPICGNDLGWKQATYDLTQYKGTVVRLWFEARNKFDEGYGVWGYVDEVKVTAASS